MSASTTTALALVSSSIARHCYDVDMSQVHANALLVDLGVDSLSLAEMVFEVEDVLGHPVADLTQRPRTVGDLMTLVQPHMAELALKMPKD